MYADWNLFVSCILISLLTTGMKQAGRHCKQWIIQKSYSNCEGRGLAILLSHVFRIPTSLLTYFPPPALSFPQNYVGNVQNKFELSHIGRYKKNISNSLTIHSPLSSLSSCCSLSSVSFLFVSWWLYCDHDSSDDAWPSTSIRHRAVIVYFP